MYSHKAKAHNVGVMNRYMLAKTIPMFEYQGLPDTIPYRELEKMLQSSGYAFITEVEGKLYAFTGGLGGKQDVYGNATEIVISNPALNYNATLNLETDGVLINSDDMRMGLLPLYEKFNFMQAENDINMVLFGYNSRMTKLISASDDSTKASAERYVKQAVDGEIAVVGENAIFDGVKLQTGTGQNNSTVTSLIEYGQYLKATLYNEVGLSANSNLKRERLVSAEVEQGEDSLFPLVYTMMKCRINAVEKINAMYGTEIVVDFGSVWLNKHRELVDDKITDKPTNPIKEKANEQQLENGPKLPDSSGTGTADKKEGQVDETDKVDGVMTEDDKAQLADIEKMLEDESLTEDDKQALIEMKAEIEGKYNE